MNPIIDHLDIWTGAWEKKASGGRGGNGKLNPYGIQKLRELILELAVRGRLAPQDPNDEPASVLLGKIAEEKARLVKEGQIRSQKKLPEISEEEKPFKLPEGWEWARLSNVAVRIHYGYTASAKPEIKEVRLLRITDIQNNSVNWESVPGCEISDEEVAQYKLEPGDILVARTGGTVGKTFLVSDLDVRAVFASYLIRIQPPEHFIIRYLKLYLESPAYWEQLVEGARGGAQPNVNGQTLGKMTVSVPPLAEQHRIVAKVDELMVLCDRLEQEQTDSREAHQTLVRAFLDRVVEEAGTDQPVHAELVEAFDLLFTTEAAIDQLKQTILQLAVMGKLVPQDPNDEPASVLLEKIAEEKALLVKEGKIKKPKKLPEITEEEKPFELPNGWLFVRLEDVVDIMSGVTKGRKLSGRKLITVPYLRVANVQRGRVDLEVLKTIDIPEEELEKYKVHQHDLLITEGGDWDKVGRTAIWHDEVPLIVHQNHVFKARRILQEQNVIWIEKYLNSVLAREYFAKSSKQTTNLASINKTQLRGCLVAIPPLAEQHRIVAKVDELMVLCDTLKARIQEAETTQRHLADAVVVQAVGQ